MWSEATGQVGQGHRVASGACGDPRFPDGTIAPQLPLIRARLPGFDAWLAAPAHPGTINLRFEGHRVRLRSPEFTLPDLRWTDRFPPETFFLSRALLVIDRGAYPAFLYIPDPATKPDHPARPDTVELLTRFLPGIGYGDRATLRYDARAITIEAG